MANVKNYQVQGGERLIIGGTIEVEGEGSILVDDVPFGPAAHQEASTAETVEGLRDDLNLLITQLTAAGLIKTD
ncbi:hypothetical protein [Salisediminibacterium selenitireducens]|uniref:Head fiber protein n=1 Tax=Bacillus selenitireducens (strain ATCC 700615 / DSM 15326 / MLS10) TaxID=439292 RepID=D6XZE8_BACIE|nr:hypothetical protein [Salisediminibacterium selenitireducens]ADH98322.1 hypothetical protein Bsel_0793 [[Bacillus] selenitireducens MLS10]